MVVIFNKETRIIFQVIIWPIVIVGVIANFGVLWRIFSSSKHKKFFLKPFYRSALLSFALSDILLLSSSSANTLSFLSDGNLLWKLPDWSCPLIPFSQTVAVLVASLTLGGVAIDRYSAMKSEHPTMRGPRKWLNAIFFVISIWLIALVASCPILQIYEIHSTIVVSDETNYHEGKLCVTSNINKAAHVYTVLFITIFLPLATVFVVVHVLLALNISQRNELMERPQIPGNQHSLSNAPPTVPNHGNSPTQICSKKHPPPAHVQHKKRTLNIILILIIVFAVCRLPLWIFLLGKLYFRPEDKFWYYLQTCFSTLSFLNAAVNPFLYAFLKETLSVVSSVCSWRKGNLEVTSINETNENGNRNQTEKVTSKIPRGPYLSAI